ncbi:MAG TPA: hypothetical protein VFV23_13485 [Verrucomicrobiae bacterium]|nr:hypothetical protein [Verrucomicrobiae bacterium]
MSSREMVIDLVNKLPKNTSLEEIAREVELLAGIEKARQQARRGEGVPAEDARNCFFHCRGQFRTSKILWQRTH